MVLDLARFDCIWGMISDNVGKLYRSSAKPTETEKSEVQPTLDAHDGGFVGLQPVKYLWIRVLVYSLGGKGGT